MVRPDEWPEVLTALERQAEWRHPSPDRVDLVELMRLYDVPAAGVAVRQEGAPTWSGGFGGAGPRTAFQACSVSKHVAAFGALRLVDRGVLDLDEDVHAYLRSWRLPDSGGVRPVVTTRQLLAHTAGLTYNWFRGFDRGTPVPTSSQVPAGAAPATSPPVRASLLPGSRYRYSGSHYAVLERLLEDACGEPFAELARALVLEPLGMADSDFDPSFPRTRGDVAAGHHVNGAPVRGGWRVQPELAGAGLWTTPADLTRLGAELDRAAAGRSGLLSREAAGQMLTPVLDPGYGLGTQLDDHGGRPRFGHTGGNIGYCCWVFTWPDTGTTVAVMLNNDGADEVLSAVLSAAERHHGRPRPTTAPTTGAYRLFDGYDLVVGETSVEVPGQPSLPLEPLGDGRFRVAGLACELAFTANGLEVRQEGVTMTATRT